MIVAKAAGMTIALTLLTLVIKLDGLTFSDQAKRITLPKSARRVLDFFKF